MKVKTGFNVKSGIIKYDITYNTSDKILESINITEHIPLHNVQIICKDVVKINTETGLEGYLLPGTYYFPPHYTLFTPWRIDRESLNNVSLNKILFSKFQNINQPFITENIQSKNGLPFYTQNGIVGISTNPFSRKFHPTENFLYLYCNTEEVLIPNTYKAFVYISHNNYSRLCNDNRSHKYLLFIDDFTLLNGTSHQERDIIYKIEFADKVAELMMEYNGIISSASPYYKTVYTPRLVEDIIDDYKKYYKQLDTLEQPLTVVYDDETELIIDFDNIPAEYNMINDSMNGLKTTDK